MGNAVKTFAKEAATSALKWVAKKGISWVGGMVPVIGTPIANAINSSFAKGGKVMNFADGGLVTKLKEEGIKTQVVNTPAQLIAAIKKFPDAAAKAGLTVEMVKDAKEQVGNAPSKMETQVEPAAPTMKRGGRKGRVEEIAEVPVKKSKKVKKIKSTEEMDGYAHGGMVNPVASLPFSNLNRLNMPSYAHGGSYDTGMGRHC